MAESNKPAVLVVLALILIVGAVVWLIVYYNPSRKHMEGRTHDERDYVYKCTADHVFLAKGRKAPRPCDVDGCSEDAYLYLVFACPRRDRVGVFLKTNPDEFRFESDTSEYWQPFDINKFFNVPCPQCGTPGMKPAPEAPG